MVICVCWTGLNGCVATCLAGIGVHFVVAFGCFTVSCMGKWFDIPGSFWFDPAKWLVTCRDCGHEVTSETGLCVHLAAAALPSS
jgi:hypothetical protein